MNNRTRVSRPSRVRLLGCALGLCLLGAAYDVAAQEAPRLVEGKVTYIEASAVEVDGVRGLIVPQSSVLSSGREVGIGGVRRGMPARLELDASGRVLELRLSGVVE